MFVSSSFAEANSVAPKTSTSNTNILATSVTLPFKKIGVKCINSSIHSKNIIGGTKENSTNGLFTETTNKQAAEGNELVVGDKCVSWQVLNSSIQVEMDRLKEQAIVL